MKNSEKINLALFDFDGTITFGDSFLSFLMFTTSYINFAWKSIKSIPVLFEYFLNRIENGKAKEKVFGVFFKGMKKDHFDDISNRYAQSKLSKLVRPEAIQSIKNLQSTNHQIVVLTATPEDILAPYCTQLGIDLIGTQLETQNGQLTGRFSSANCFGEEKVNRLMNKYDLKHCKLTHGYGDKTSDLHFMRLTEQVSFKPFRKTSNMAFPMHYASEILKLMRIHHWLKNALLFFPLLFVGGIMNTGLLWQVTLGFFAFSFMASAVYCFNDIADVDADRQDSKKRHRPIAANTISTSAGYLISAALVTISLSLSAQLGLAFFGLVAVYFLMNILYSLHLKSIAFVDVTIIASGFIIRIFCGGVLTDIPISPWLIIITFLLSILLAFGKRRPESDQPKEIVRNTKSSIYTRHLIDTSILFFCGITIASYILYTISPEVISRVNSDYLYITCVPVIVGFIRYIEILIWKGSSIDPIELLTSDKRMQCIVAVWFIIFIGIIYV